MSRQVVRSGFNRLRFLVRRRFLQETVPEAIDTVATVSGPGRIVASVRTVISIARSTIRRFSDEEGMHLAAGVAFYALLSVVPMALLFVSIFSYFAEPEEITSWIVERFGEETPVSPDFLLETVEGARAIRGPASILGFFGTILSSTLAFAAIMRSINRAWGLIGTGTRTFLRRKLWEFALLVAVAFLLLLAYAAANIFDVLREGPLPGTHIRLSVDNSMWRFFLTVLPFAAIAGMLALMYKLIPTTDVRWREALLPGLLAALALMIANALLGWYIHNLGYYNAVYGSLASVIVLLLWIYVCANIVIVGAALSAVLFNRRHHPASPGGIPIA